MREPLSLEAAVDAAEAAAAKGHYSEAEVHYRSLLRQTHAAHYEYEEWLRQLGDVYANLGQPREAAYVYLYLHAFDLMHELISGPGLELERALCALGQKRFSDAAEAFLRAGRPVQAAVAFEEAKAYGGARDLWAQLLGDSRIVTLSYERALAHFNLGMAMLRVGADQGVQPSNSDGARQLVMAQRLLEQVADDLETQGKRERAFDCYQILIRLGRDSGQFENLAEGYLNCIRILKEDGLKFYALQYYEDFIKLAETHGELHAAATLHREAADLSLRSGLPYHSRYLSKSAETWWRAAGSAEKEGAPVEVVENALAASLDGFSLVGDFGRVSDTYDRLSRLDLGERKAARYRALATRFRAAPQRPALESPAALGPALPEYLRRPHAYADIWFLDLVEWEMDGDAEQVAQAMVGDLRHPDGFRRRALCIVLEMAHARRHGVEVEPQVLARLAKSLGELQCYAALRPLERLYEHENPKVRAASVRALKSLHFKRSFGLVSAGLVDPDPGVTQAALEALQGLVFTHAFQPLQRIFRDAPDTALGVRVRIVALEAMGRIGSVEAGEFLVGILRYEGGPVVEAARRALLSFESADVIPLLRQHAEMEGDVEIRQILGEIIGRVRRH